MLHCSHLQNLTVGAKLWGSVLEIGPRELVISLPHGLRGHVAYTQASDVLGEFAAASPDGTPLPSSAAKRSNLSRAKGTAAHPLPALADVFEVGQLVRCCVTALLDGSTPGAGARAGSKLASATPAATGAASGKRRRIQLSLCAAAVNAELGERRMTAGGAAEPAPIISRRARPHHFPSSSLCWGELLAVEARWCSALPFNSCFECPPVTLRAPILSQARTA